MSELKPCPFCGGEAKVARDVTCGYETFWAHCLKCHSQANYGHTEAEAIAAWNTRAECENCAALNKAAGLWAKADKRARDLERTCRMFPSDYYPCAEDDCLRLSIRMWTCSECEADYLGNKPNYCPNCGARVTPKCSETTPKVVSE